MLIKNNQGADNIPKLRFPEFIGEWEKKKLGEVADITTGSTPSTIIEEYYNGNKLFVSPADMQGNRYIYQTKTTLTNLGFSKGRKISKGSVLFVCIGSTIGKVGIPMEDCLTNQQINSLNGKSCYCNDFIYTLLEKNGSEIKLIAGVQAVPQINKTDFSNLHFFFPSLPEQQKIASFLSAVDEKLQALKKKKSLLEQYKKGVMQKIFCLNHDSLDYHDDHDFEEEQKEKKSSQSSPSQKSRLRHIRFRDDDGNEFAEWEVKKLGDCLDYIQPTKYLVESTEYDNSYATPVLTAGKTFILGYTNETQGIFKDNLPVIIFDDFTTATQFVDFPFKAKSSAMKILVAKENVNIKFIYEAMNIMKYEIGGHERHWISKFTLMDILVPSINEQMKIANFLSAIDEKIQLVQGQVDKMEVWKKGLLQKMFV